MLMVWRRSSRRSRSFIAVTSAPLTRICPRVGSTSRDRQRINVDLPLPDSPMTTKISPSITSSDTLRTASTWPVCSNTALRVISGVVCSAMCAAAGPNTFHRL
jgi:hypothetical protein